jgi:hypothetical protein
MEFALSRVTSACHAITAAVLVRKWRCATHVKAGYEMQKLTIFMGGL